MSFEDRLTTACGCAEAIELGVKADARIAELEASADWATEKLAELAAERASGLARIAALEAALSTVNHTLGDMHDNSPACLFNGAKGEDVGCLACVAQQQIEKGLEGE